MFSILYWILVGGVAGWIAGLLLKGKGFGITGNIIVGIVGALVGRLIFWFIGLSATAMLGSLAMAVVGAVALLFLVGYIKSK